MDRTVISPLIFILLAYFICARTIPAITHQYLIWPFLLIIILNLTNEIGQFCRQNNQLGLAEFFLRISVWNRLWLFIPGTYPADLFITSSNQLAKVLCDRQKYAEALALNTENIELLKKRQGPDSQSLAGELICRAYIFGEMGDGDNALKSGQEALSILDHAGSTAATSLALNNLGTTYLKLGKTEEGLAALKRALLVKETLGIKQSSLACAYGNIGYGLLCDSKFTEAEEFLRKAASLSDSADARFKATFRNNLGEALRGQGKLDEAEKWLNESLQIRKSALSKTDPHLAFSYHNLAKLMVDNQKFDQAEDYFKKALNIRSKFPGVKNRDLNETNQEYYKLLKKLGRSFEAEALTTSQKRDIDRVNSPFN